MDKAYAEQEWWTEETKKAAEKVRKYALEKDKANDFYLSFLSLSKAKGAAYREYLEAAAKQRTAQAIFDAAIDRDWHAFKFGVKK